MCGIVGIVSKCDASKICFGALEKLEYRGYDSAGIAGTKNKKIEIFKKQGFVENIKDFCENANFKTAIAHTRWATHGMPCEKNAHPILSECENFAIVHNGVIENYAEIKNELESESVVFKTDTDTEVVCNLIAKQSGKPLERLKKACDRLVGSFAFALLNKKSQDIFVAKQSSPLYVAKTKSGNMVASDVLCFEKGAKYYALSDGEFAVVSKNKIQVYDNCLKKKKVCFEELDFENQEIEKCGCSFFMQKEIFETPAVIKRICSAYSKRENLADVLDIFKGIKNIHVIACGTAYHAGLYGSKILSETLGIPAKAFIASEYRYDKTAKEPNTLAILVSQSGETADTLKAGEKCRENGYKILALVNAKESSVARFADVSVLLCAGKEIGVASTKAYVAMLLVFRILSGYLKDENFDVSALEKLEEATKNCFGVSKEIVEMVKNANRVFFVGRQYDSITALEGALKLKEISYKSAEGYPAGELKHGTLALIDKGTPVFVISTDKNMHEKTIVSAEEVHSRGGVVVLVSPKSFSKGCSDFRIELQEFETTLCSLLAIIPLQQIALETAVGLGKNPDKPRNLAKSVTVE